jgi:hypothetical protein
VSTVLCVCSWEIVFLLSIAERTVHSVPTKCFKSRVAFHMTSIDTEYQNAFNPYFFVPGVFMFKVPSLSKLFNFSFLDIQKVNGPNNPHETAKGEEDIPTYLFGKLIVKSISKFLVWSISIILE